MLLNHIKKKILELIFYVKLFIIKKLHKIVVPKKINIGGGSNFNEFSWLNYDVNSILSPFKFDENTSFPNKDNSINIVYTSHTLEHFSDKVVHKVLNEINRVLISGGSLLIIIPDYDFIIKKWREKDLNFFYNTQELGFDKHLKFWKNKNISDNLDNRAAFMFCSYWNSEFENRFRAFQSKKNNEYHPKVFWGPPNYDSEVIKSILLENSPKKIVDYLREMVIKKNSDYIFCHQNAWSKEELISLVINCGFKLIESDKNIIKNYPSSMSIKGFFDHYRLSNYFFFKKE